MMKKIIIYLLLVFVPVILYSKKVDIETAKQIARKVYKMDVPDKSQSDILKCKSLSLEGDTLLYVFSYPYDGYVIISADNAAPPVLGHCTKGKFVQEDMPPGLLFLIEKYKYSIANLKKNKTKPLKKVEDQWAKYLDESYPQFKSYNIGDHLLNTTWGQSSGYNSNCPTGCPAGCTAVAMAQILRYWECRIAPAGIVDYSGSGWEGGYANIGATTYNWLNMGNNIDDAYNALLISHAGLSCQTHYKATGSTSTPGRARDGFVNNWGISSDADVKWRIWHLSNWEDMLKDELDLQRPILYSAGGAEIGDDWFYGHSWVLDGYNEDDEFYCNWGWYGESNGWYSLGFDPPGDKGPYNQIESAIFDVVPVQLTGVATPQLTSETFAYNPNGYTLSVPETFGATSYQWSTDQGSISGNGRTAILYSNCSANVSVRAYNNVCNIYSTYDTEQFNIKYEISGPSNLCSSGATYSVPNLPQGSYVSWSFSSNIQSYYGGNTWIALRAIGNGAGWVQATITNTNCGNITLPRMTVWAGIPTAYNFYTEVNGEEVEYYDVGLICPNTINCFDAESELDEMEVSDYTWHLPQGYTVWSGNGNGLCFDANGVVGSPIIGDVTNSCGTGYGVIQLYLGDNGCSRSYQYAISPNPASTELTVEQLTTEEAVGRSVLEPAEVYDLSDTKDADDGSYTVEIWHEKKGKVKSVESKSKKEMIDVSKLEKGYYILHIRTKQALYQEHILVK